MDIPRQSAARRRKIRRLLFGVGGIVALVAMSMFMPMFDLTSMT